MRPPADFAEFPTELGPKDGDIVITKRQWGAFTGTELDLQLRRRGITQTATQPVRLTGQDGDLVLVARRRTGPTEVMRAIVYAPPQRLPVQPLGGRAADRSGRRAASLSGAAG
ncbi:isochorismatase family protein [Streptomyces sp. 4.24]|uniref:isochorismatase family protein n=1 Tax=Streptomyces tritrimontium TaxID=3406573 RepID=UPI003BB4B7C2